MPLVEPQLFKAGLGGPRVPPQPRLLEAVPCPAPCWHPGDCAGATCEMLQVVGARCWSSPRRG